MIDTPITKKFFKKLELYLELKRQNRRSKKSERGFMTWRMEKSFLLWAIRGHWYMGIPLDFERVQKVLHDAGYSNDWAKYSNQVMQNLVFKKFACYYPEGEKSIQITNEGFLMAETIEDADSKMEYFYILSIIFVWLAVALAFLKVIFEILRTFNLI